MEKITFANDSEPYLSAENLNQMQDNIENDIGILSNLSTSEKSSLVGAINEVNEKNIIYVYENGVISIVIFNRDVITNVICFRN